ncbi:MAG: hypothetical protein N2689_18335, partial [Verrucomicrobiae bacterium]|nr:hypothetical protein [Verrucomicrobiae bacterium]
EWLPHARRYGFLLAAPEFSQAAFPGDDGYALGVKTAFRFIEPVFDAVKAATGNRSERYHLYGHSAGAQFVHRFLYFAPRARGKGRGRERRLVDDARFRSGLSLWSARLAGG